MAQVWTCFFILRRQAKRLGSEKQISYGQFITCPPNLAETTIVAYNQAGNLVALLTPRDPDLLKPKKVVSQGN